MSFQLNPELDVDQLSQEFQSQKKLRVDNIFSLDSAETILDTLHNYTAWHLVYSDQDGLPVRLDNAELESTSTEQLQAKVTELQLRANNSYQYMYKFFPIVDAIQSGRINENSLLYEIAAFLNGTEFLKFSRTLTNTQTLVKMDPQATLYEAGHFLNLHDDMGDQRESVDGSVRRYALVFGFTKNWSANWGGQTNFFPSAGSPVAESWYPGFNSMTIFEVPVLHNVSYVSPFANKGRYSITGWLRDDANIERPDLDSNTSSESD